MAKVKNHNKLLSLSLLTNLIFLPFFLLLMFYLFNPFLDYLVINKSLPRLCNYLITANQDPEAKCNRVLEAWSSNDTSTWKTYTNTVGKFSIMYPPNWTLNESHTLSNRVVDDPKEINTAIIKKGSDNEVMFRWGPMGFGGGCDEKDHKKLMLKEATVEICNGISSDATYNFDGDKINGEHEGWSQIYPPDPKREPAFGADAIALKNEGDTVRRIFSTLEFTQ